MSTGFSRLILMAATYLAPFFGWAAVFYMTMHVVKILKKRRGIDLKTRMFREFQLANKEVIPYLSSKEKTEMVNVINTTIMNAQLFRSKSGEFTESQKVRKSNKTVQKKVCFQLPPQRSI